LSKSRSKNYLKYFLREFSAINLPEYAHVGEKPNRTIILYKGTDAFSNLSFSIEPYLRKLGVNT
jgi:hypothetical protein